MTEIAFNKELYPIEAINRAVKAYKGLAKFSIQKRKGYIRVFLNDIREDLKDVIKDEFSNYVLYSVKIL